VPDLVPGQEIIVPVEKPLKKTGHLQVLYGNLALVRCGGDLDVDNATLSPPTLLLPTRPPITTNKNAHYCHQYTTTISMRIAVITRSAPSLQQCLIGVHKVFIASYSCVLVLCQ